MERSIFVLVAIFALAYAAPRVDKDYLGCEVCHVMVEDMKNLIAENQTQVNLESRLEDICKRLTADVDVCLNFVHSNSGKIFGKIVQSMNPEEVCILLEVCPKSTEVVQVQPIEEHVKEATEHTESRIKGNPVECEICKLLIVEIDQYIKRNASESTINKTVEEICNKLPSALKTFCLTYEPKIVQALLAGLDPQKACAKVTLCSSVSSEEKVEEEEEEEELMDEVRTQPKAPTLECEICKLLVTEVDRLLETNRSVASINQTVYNVCARLPSALQTFCLTYAPEIVTTLSQGFDPTKACETIKLCTETTQQKQPPRVAKEISPEESAPQDAKCEVCQFLVNTIDQFISKNDSEAKINSTVYSLCNLMPAAIKATCDLIAPSLVKDIEKGLDPQQTCARIKMCPNTTAEQFFEEETFQEEVSKKTPDQAVKSEVNVKDAKCEVCEFLITLIDQAIEKNASAEKINSTVYGLCNLLPAAIKATCDLIAPTIVKELAGGLDPAKACAAVKLCPNTSFEHIIEEEEQLQTQYHTERKMSELQNPKQLKDAKCEVCEFVISMLDQVIEENASFDKINNTMYELCNLLPGAVKVTCDVIAPSIVKAVAGGLDPKKACAQIKLCTNTSSEVIVEKPLEEEGPKPNPVQAGEFCELCEFVIQLVDTYLEKNATAGKINDTVYGVCNVLPAELKAICDSFAPQVVQVLESGLDPQEACTKINLCINGTFESLRNRFNIPCDLCKEGIEAAMPRKFNEEVAMSACSLICADQQQQQHVIHRRSAKKFTEFVEQQVSGMNKKVHLDEDWQCDVCMWLAEAANIFLEDNKTEENIARNLDSLCKFLPKPYDKVCTDTTPLIVKELEHGVEPKKLCKEIMDGDWNCENWTKTPEIPRQLIEKMYDAQRSDSEWECKFCNNVIEALREDIDTSSDSVMSYLKDVCNRMPKPTSTACSTFVKQEYQTISSFIIKRLLSPNETCHMIKLCDY